MADRDETLGFYAANAATYARRAKRASSANVDRLLRHLPPGAKILELGSGGGQDAALVLARGYDVTPTDGSPELAAEAEALLGRPVRIMLFDQLDERDAYDGVFANASLLHVPRAELTGVLCRIHRAMRPGGYFYASYKAGTSAGRDQFGRYYSHFSEIELRARYLAAAPWASLEVEAWDGSGYDQLPTRWLGVVTSK